MSSVLLAELQQLVSAHGYWVVAIIVGLESMGLPLPDPWRAPPYIRSNLEQIQVDFTHSLHA